MEKIIGQIIAIEDMAQKVIEEAKEENKNLDGSIKKSIDAKKHEIETKVHEKSEHIQKFEEEHAEKRIAEAEKTIAKEKINLEEIYNKNKDAWIDKIFANIVND